MKAKFGAIVVDGRGKIGGHVASKNRGGAYFRTKVTPVNPQTGYQAGVRNRFTSLSQAWKGLTAEARDAWNSAVASYQRTDIFGDLKTPSGFNLYQRLNNVLISVGEAALAMPPLPTEVANVYATSVSNAIGVPAMSLTLNEAVPADTAVKLFATAPQSAGRSYVKSQFRLIAILPAAEASPYNMLADYQAKFGTNGAIGQKIFVKTVPCSTVSGQEGSAAIVSVIAAA